MKSKHSPTRNPFFNLPRQTGGSARVVLLATLAFALGIGGGAILFYGKSSKTTVIQPGSPAGGLSAATLSVLEGLKGPVEIHYYAILDPNGASAAEQELGVRTDRLLAEYEAAAGSKLKITRHDAASDMGPQAAAKDGITPFNLDKGDACYLGIAVLGNDQKETFARLSPEWESALESDLSRAIARVDSARPGAAKPAAPPVLDQTAINEVKRALPNLASLTAEQGAEILREAALKESQTAIAEMSAQIQTAQTRLAESRANGSEAEQQAALKEFQRVQSEQIKRLQSITSRLQSQIETLHALKAQ